MAKDEINLQDFDYGFTAVAETELEAVPVASQADATASTDTKEKQDKMDTMYNAMIPLLNNLQKNPEKEYIYWPDRHNKVEQFRDKLTILNKS